jgi:hypothetical protein
MNPNKLLKLSGNKNIGKTLISNSKENTQIANSLSKPNSNKKLFNITEELKKCRRDPKYFINNYCWTELPDGGKVPFKLWDFQEKTIDDFVKYRFNIVLKSRQMGISWISAAFALWMIIFYESRTILCIADKQATAQLIINKIKFMLSSLPNWMQDALVIRNEDLITDNKLSIELANNSKVIISSTTNNAGRGITASLLLIDEASIIDNMEDTWKALKPSVIVGGRVIMFGTPRGVSNFFYKIYTDAEAQISDFHAICLGWELHPARNDNWAREQIKNDGVTFFRQEYACQFLGSDATMIDADLLMKFENSLIQEPKEIGKDLTHGLWLWKKPDPGHKYIASIDISSGEQDISMGESADKSKTDFSACTILDLQTNEIVCEYYGKIRPLIFAKILYELCNQYNKALLVFESNAGWALPIFDYFTEKDYLNIYHQPKQNEKGIVDFKNQNNRPGFATTKANRQKILENLRQGIETGELRFYSKRFLNELKTFSYNPKKERYEASNGNHDDLIMACAIGWYVKLEYRLHYERDSFIPMITGELLKQSAQIKKSFGKNPFDHIMNKIEESKEMNNRNDGIILTDEYIRKSHDYFVDPKTGVDAREIIGEETPKVIVNDNVQKSIFDHFIDKDSLEEFKSNPW